MCCSGRDCGCMGMPSEPPVCSEKCYKIYTMKAYCINLKERADRWAQVQADLAKLQIPVERFEAIWDVVGHQGCIKSHVQLIRQVKHEGLFMILEDDIKLIGSMPDLFKALAQLPPDWDMLYLGATLMRPLVRYSPNLFRLQSGMTTHAIIYNNQNRVCEYIIEHMNGAHVDVFMMQVQKLFNCYITYPMIMTQFPGDSDTTGDWTDYEEIERTYNKYTK